MWRSLASREGLLNPDPAQRLTLEQLSDRLATAAPPAAPAGDASGAVADPAGGSDGAVPTPTRASGEGLQAPLLAQTE